MSACAPVSGKAQALDARDVPGGRDGQGSSPVQPPAAETAAYMSNPIRFNLSAGAKRRALTTGSAKAIFPDKTCPPQLPRPQSYVSQLIQWALGRRKSPPLPACQQAFRTSQSRAALCGVWLRPRCAARPCTAHASPALGSIRICASGGTPGRLPQRAAACI